MKGLTKRQKEIVDYIDAYIQSHGYSPSYRDIASHFDFSSVGSVYSHIQTLIRKGALDSETNCGRSLNLPKQESPESSNDSSIELPFIGHITAGEPLEIFPNIQSATVPASLVPSPSNTYVLRCSGSSLHDEFIDDGDLILVETRSDPNPGETVLAIDEARSAHIKKYFPEGNSIRLEARTPNVPSRHYRLQEITIHGTVVGTIRFYQ